MSVLSVLCWLWMCGLFVLFMMTHNTEVHDFVFSDEEEGCSPPKRWARSWFFVAQVDFLGAGFRLCHCVSSIIVGICLCIVSVLTGHCQCLVIVQKMFVMIAAMVELSLYVGVRCFIAFFFKPRYWGSYISFRMRLCSPDPPLTVARWARFESGTVVSCLCLPRTPIVYFPLFCGLILSLLSSSCAYLGIVVVIWLSVGLLRYVLSYLPCDLAKCQAGKVGVL